MKIVDHTEVGKYYLAYWKTENAHLIMCFKQVKEPSFMNKVRVDDEQLVYFKIVKWPDEPIKDDTSYYNTYASLSFYDYGGKSSAMIYELDDDEIRNHIIMENI